MSLQNLPFEALHGCKTPIKTNVRSYHMPKSLYRTWDITHYFYNSTTSFSAVLLFDRMVALYPKMDKQKT